MVIILGGSITVLAGKTVSRTRSHVRVLERLIHLVFAVSFLSTFLMLALGRGHVQVPPTHTQVLSVVAHKTSWSVTESSVHSAQLLVAGLGTRDARGRHVEGVGYQASH